MKSINVFLRRGLYMVMFMLAMGMVVACSSDDDDDEGGAGAGGSQSVIGSWRLQKVIYYENGKIDEVDDYTGREPEDGHDNYLFITETTLTYSVDREGKETKSYPISIGDGLLIFKGGAWTQTFMFEGASLVLGDEDGGFEERWYYNRI